MIIHIGIAIGAFLISGLVTAVLRPSVISKLMLAFVVFVCVMSVQYLPEVPPEGFLGHWALPYGASLGTFLGVGSRYWKPSWWANLRKTKASFEFSFASRITFRAQRSISGLVVKLGILSIALGVMVMQVAISIVNGFQGAIQEKVIGFGSHLQIGNLLEELESEVNPLPRYNKFIPEIAEMDGVRNVSPYILKPCMLKSKETQEGIVLKGVDSTYNWTFFEGALKAGRIPDVTQGRRYSKEILISQRMADVLNVELEDKIIAYFFNTEAGRVNFRQFSVTGIYETGLGEFDEINAFCDLRAPQEVWKGVPMPNARIVVIC
ncbi:MAG: ABC transporter permease [Bacteroidota bacterium]